MEGKSGVSNNVDIYLYLYTCIFYSSAYTSIYINNHFFLG